MDELDEKIIKYLKEDASVPLSEIALQLKVPQPTVYARVNKLKKEGVIRKFTIILNEPKERLNAAVLECKDYLISKMTARTEVRVIEALKENPGVKLVVKMEGSKLLVAWSGELELERIEGVEKVIPAKISYFSD